MVLYFPTEDATDTDFYGEELAELSKSAAVFVKFPYTADREKSPWAEESIVPISKMLSDNPAREYGVSAKGGEIRVCDWFGNDYVKLSADVKADALKTAIDGVAKKASDANDKLAKDFAKAQAAFDKGDRKGAVKTLLKNFETGKVGLAGQQDSIRLYNEIMDAVRAEIEAHAEAGETDKIKAIAKDLKGTDAEKAAEEALGKKS